MGEYPKIHPIWGLEAFLSSACKGFLSDFPLQRLCLSESAMHQGRQKQKVCIQRHVRPSKFNPGSAMRQKNHSITKCPACLRMVFGHLSLEFSGQAVHLPPGAAQQLPRVARASSIAKTQLPASSLWQYGRQLIWGKNMLFVRWEKPSTAEKHNLHQFSSAEP